MEKSVADSERWEERSNRILDAAYLLTLRWGYKKTTLDDIARQAGVAKSTIYQHWKTKEALLLALLKREKLREGQKFVECLATDPEGATLHGMIKYGILISHHNPFLKAIWQQDTDVLGDLISSEITKRDLELQRKSFQEYLQPQRASGLVRSDLSVEESTYILFAVTTGFMLVDQFLPEGYNQLSLEDKARLAADIIQRTLELRDTTREERQEVVQSYEYMYEQLKDSMDKE